MEFLVLGPVAVHRDGVPVSVGGSRQRAVLSRLLVSRGDVVPVDRLIDDLWSGEPTPSALGVLQAYISHLRRALEPDRPPRSPATVLISKVPGYALVARSDADDFADLLNEGITLLSSGEAAMSADVLARAEDLWRGEPYSDVADEPWAGAEVARLQELRLVGHEHRLAAQLVLGQAHRAVPDLEGLVADNPLREGLWRLLALALYRTSRQADALAALRRARAILLEELGLDPSPALQELETSILEQAPALGSELSLIELTAPSRSESQPEDRPSTPQVSESQPSEDRSTTRVFGRAMPWSTLREEARTAVDGHPRAVLVSGEAGIGKTWLVRAFAQELEAQSWRVHWANSHEAAGAPALWPWLQILEELGAEHPLPDGLQALLDGAGPVDWSSSGDARFRQHEAVRRYLTEVAADRPLLMVFDDIQWADAGSLHLLADTLTLSRSGRILAVSLTRPDPEGRHEQALVRLDRVGPRMSLSALDEQALYDMAVAAGHEVSGALLLDRTGGNPLFARETLRVIQQIGIEAGLTRVPESVGDLVRQRVAVLPPETQTVLQVAAVLGRDVDLDALLEISGQTEEEVWDAIDSCVVAGILLEPATAPRFAHDLVREAVYADLAPLRRSRLHAKAVDVLQRSPVVEVARLAEHAYAAGPVSRPEATRWAMAAARQSSARFAHEDAVRWWLRAVESHARERDGDPQQQVELLLSLLRAQVDAGDAIGARETRNRAVLAADGLTDRDLRRRALVALDAPALWLLRQFDEPELGIVARLERELADLVVENDGDSEMRCRLLATLAEELYDVEPDPRCDELSVEAIAMARRLERPDLLVVALNARYLSTNRDNPGPQAGAIARELQELGARNGWPSFALLGYLLGASSDLHLGDLARADEQAAQADRLIRRLDLLLPRMQGMSYWVARRQLDGRFEESAALLREFGQLGFSWWAFDGLYAGQQLTQLFLSEQFQAADPSLIATAARARPSLAHDFQLLVDGGADRPNGWPEPAQDWAWLIMTVVRAETAARFGDDEVRRSTYKALLPFTGRFAYSASFGAPVDWYLARLAEALGQVDAARHHLLALEAACRRESLDWWGARSRSASLALT